MNLRTRKHSILKTITEINQLGLENKPINKWYFYTLLVGEVFKH